MKFNFKQSLLLLTSTYGVLAISNSTLITINPIHNSNFNYLKKSTIKGNESISKFVIAESQGDVELNTKNSNLRFQHSNFTPTGIFVTRDSLVTIFNSTDNVYAFIGQWGEYKDLNDGQNIEPQKYALNSESFTIINPETEGVLYISNQNIYDDIEVMIDAENVIEIPTFKINETTTEEFNQKLNNTTSPFVELIGNNVFGTFQISLANELWKNNLQAIEKITETIQNWDEIYEMSNYVSGLSLEYDGVAKKQHNLLHITNPDSGPGYASATTHRITFQQNTGAGKSLFTDKNDQWGLWHEIGHTYQNQDYNFDGFSEVSVNINSFWIQEEQGFGNRMFGRESTIKAIENYINSNDPKKTITDLDIWGRLGMYLQLHMAYGKEFFPRLNQEYRLLHWTEKPQNNAEKYQTFIRISSKTVNRNLIPFFEKWGIHANSETTKAVQEYPLLQTDIWNNLFDNHIEDKAIIDYKLDKYNPVSGIEVDKNASINLNIGDQTNTNEVKKYLHNLNDNMIISDVIGPNWNSINWNNENTDNYSFAKIVEPNKTGNKYLIPTKITTNNSLRTLGIGDRDKGIFGLNTTEKKFFVSPTNSELHSYFKDKTYISIAVIDNNGNTVYKEDANGDESTMKFNELNKISYDNDYKIEFWFAEANRGLYYDNNQWNKVQDKNTGTITFIIVNDNWVKI